jgi:hypothetical protein
MKHESQATHGKQRSPSDKRVHIVLTQVVEREEEHHRSDKKNKEPKDA